MSDAGEEFEYRDEDEGARGSLSDSIRKALVTGLSAVMLTEEGIRGAIGDLRLPKEAIAYLSAQTERTRKEFFRLASDELKGFLKKIDLTDEVRKALVGLKVEVKAELRFVDEGAPRTTVKAELKDVEEPAPKTKTKTKTKPRRRRKS